MQPQWSTTFHSTILLLCVRTVLLFTIDNLHSARLVSSRISYNGKKFQQINLFSSLDPTPHLSRLANCWILCCMVGLFPSLWRIAQYICSNYRISWKNHDLAERGWSGYSGWIYQVSSTILTVFSKLVFDTICGVMTVEEELYPFVLVPRWPLHHHLSDPECMLHIRCWNKNECTDGGRKSKIPVFLESMHHNVHYYK